MDAANCAAVLLSVPISYYFHGCTALLVSLVVVSAAILKIYTPLNIILSVIISISINIIILLHVECLFQKLAMNQAVLRGLHRVHASFHTSL